MIDVVGMFVAGVVIATTAMFSGLGGGVLWVPWLIVGMGVAPREAVLAALVIQVFGQLAGTVANWRQGLVCWPVFSQQVVVAVPGVMVGAVLSRTLRPAWLEMILGFLMFFVAYLFLRGDDLFSEGGAIADLQAGRRVRWLSALGGALTGLLSVGVGDLIVPALNKSCHLRMAHAVATGVALMLVLSSLAAAIHMSLGGRFPGELVFPAIAGVLVGAPVGSFMHLWVSEVRFKELFVLLLVLIAAHVLFNSM